jgi:DNA-nicking Smr family endonuclease
MLEAALQDLSREEIEREKYDQPERGLDIDPGETDNGGDADDSESSETSESTPSPTQEGEAGEGTDDDEQHRADARQQREMFERAMSDVDRMEASSKYRSPSTPEPDEAAERAEAVSRRTVDDLNTPTLPTSGEALREVPPLDERQQALKRRFDAWDANHQTPEINLRGETKRDAISRLSSFLAQANHHQAQFVRVVTGRGRRSDGPPAVKLAVLEWLEGRGITHIEGYIPERLVDGDYGSLVVELRDAADA